SVIGGQHEQNAMHLNTSNRSVVVSIMLLVAASSPTYAGGDPSSQLTNDIAMIILERLDKNMEVHHSMMRSDLCEAALRRHDQEGDFLETLEFPDAKVTGIVKGWVCIKPDGKVLRSKSLPESK